MSRPRVVINIDDANCARDLSAGGMFVGPDAIAASGCTLSFNDEIDLGVRGATGELTLHARVVFVDPAKGAGLELVGFGPEMKAKIAELQPVSAPLPVLTEPPPIELLDLDAPETTERIDLFEAADLAADNDTPAPDSTEADRTEADSTEGAGTDEPPEDDGDTSAEGTERKKLALTMHERLRGLTMVEQIKKANSADPSERMTLERIYGKTVWEALLRNPRLTAPEVSRLARLGTMPRTLIELIVNNGSWMQVPEIRRALLTNPRLGTDQILRVLRLLSKNELKVASSLMTYTFAVRDAAKKLLKTET
jgi:hypothetical protein